MFFVRFGSVFYTDSSTDLPTLEVKKHQWACEETLWSKVSLVAGPFRASPFGCEMIFVLPGELQTIARIHPYALRFCCTYAGMFIKALNDASKDTSYANLLFNDSAHSLNLVFNACERAYEETTLKSRFSARIAAMGQSFITRNKSSPSLRNTAVGESHVDPEP